MDWLLHIDPGQPAPYTMAKDDYCLSRAIATGVPVLRLYGWERLVLSLGRAQKASEGIDLAACRELKIPMIRRGTGGRAVLHGRDLTYSVAAPLNSPAFNGGVMGVYRSISQVFVAFFNELGFQPTVKSYNGRERAAMASPNCFATPSAFEILIDGKKLIGSAQRRRAEGFLQHGSIPLLPQHEILARLYPGSTAESIASQMTNLEQMGTLKKYGEDKLKKLLVETFERVLNFTASPAPWSADDERAVQAKTADYPLIWPAAPCADGQENPADAGAARQRPAAPAD